MSEQTKKRRTSGVIYVRNVKGRAAWNSKGTYNIPESYDFLPAGDGALTRRVKASGDTVFAVLERTRFGEKATGIWAEASLIESCRSAIKRTSQQERRRRRERQERRDSEVFAASIRERFPSMPEEEASKCAQHSCEIGSGRAGRSGACEDPVFLAVLAHARHWHTDYEEEVEYAVGDHLDYLDIKARANKEARLILEKWKVPKNE